MITGDSSVQVHHLHPSDARGRKQPRLEPPPGKRKGPSGLPSEQVNVYLVHGSNLPPLDTAPATKRPEILSNYTEPPRYGSSSFDSSPRLLLKGNGRNKLRSCTGPVRLNCKPRGHKRPSNPGSKAIKAAEVAVQPPPIPQEDNPFMLHTPTRIRDQRTMFNFGMPGFTFSLSENLTSAFGGLKLHPSSQ